MKLFEFENDKPLKYKQIDLNFFGMTIDDPDERSSAEDDGSGNLHFSNGDLVLNDHIIGTDKILKPKVYGNFLIIFRVNEKGVTEVNIINSKGELQLGKWKTKDGDEDTSNEWIDIGAFVMFPLDNNFVLKNLPKGNYAENFVVKLKEVPVAVLVPDGDHLININDLGIAGEGKEIITAKRDAEHSVDRVIVDVCDKYDGRLIGHNIIGKDYKLISELDFNRITFFAPSGYDCVATKCNIDGKEYLNIYNMNSQEFMFDKYFYNITKKSLSTYHTYMFMKFTDGTCKIADYNESKYNNKLIILEGTYDDIVEDEDSSMFLAKKGESYFVINGEDIDACENARFFSLFDDTDTEKLRYDVRCYLIKTGGNWYVKKLNTYDTPIFEKPILGEGIPFDSFDVLYNFEVLIYKGSKCNILNCKTGIEYPDIWFDEIENLYHEGTRHLDDPIIGRIGSQKYKLLYDYSEDKFYYVPIESEKETQ